MKYDNNNFREFGNIRNIPSTTFWVLSKKILTLLFLGITIGLFMSTMLVNITLTSKPTAMDVYQDKTTLEYTIRDGEIIDSVVVYK